MKDNIRRMPYNKTHRREKQLEAEDFDKMLKAGRRKNWIQFISLLTLLGIILVGSIYLISIIPEIVQIFTGAS